MDDLLKEADNINDERQHSTLDLSESNFHKSSTPKADGFRNALR